MARTPNTDERRAQIVAALIHVMARRGYDGASIGDIAKRAGLAPGLVHYHFENKLEILIAAVRAIAAGNQAVLEARLAATEDPAAQLVAFVEVHLGLGAEANPDALACWVLVCAEALREQRVQVEVERVLAALAARLTDIVDRGDRAKQFACSEPAAAAAALLATIQGYFTVAAIARPLIPAGSAARMTLQMAAALLHPARPWPTHARTTPARRRR